MVAQIFYNDRRRIQEVAVVDRKLNSKVNQSVSYDDEPILVAPTIDDIETAALALKGYIVETPLFENNLVNEMLEARLLVKAEMFQKTGSFKFRGAYNRIRLLSDEATQNGVIAYSSGNHAQAVAYAAKLMSTQALIVMPTDAPINKVTGTRKLGAKIITYDRTRETREIVAQKICAERDYVMVPPNEDLRVLAGAGTLALELIKQAKSLGKLPDVVLVPCGGGGLTAATAIAIKALSPSTKVYAVEPELFDDTRRSLEVGKRVANLKGLSTICDAIMTDTPGKLTFSVNRELLSGVLTVSDDDVRTAMKFAFEEFKIVVEPGAAVALAAVLAKKINIEGKTIAVIATGGNVDVTCFSDALRTAKTPHDL